MKKKLMLVINPAAGKGGYKYNLGEALHLLDRGGYNTTLFFTSRAKEAIELTAENAGAYDTVACVGGDGTLSEVMSGLMTIKSPPPLGYIPMGTANDIATTLGLPKNDTIGAVKRIIEGTAHPYDVGGFGDDGHFAYIAAFGAFTEASYTTPQSQKKMLGHLAYVLQGASLLPKIEAFNARVEYDNGVFEGKLMYGSMSNSTSVAGVFKLSNKLVSLGDGMSELVLVKDPGSVEGIGDILTSVITQKYDSDKLMVIQTKKAKFYFDKPIAWTRDGEAGGEYAELQLCNFHAPLQMIF